MEGATHLSEVWNIAFPIEENGSSLMFVSDLLGCNPKNSIPIHDDGSKNQNQSDDSEIHKLPSLEEKDRSVTELIVGDHSFGDSYGIKDSVLGCSIISPHPQILSQSKQQPRMLNSGNLIRGKTDHILTGIQTGPALYCDESIVFGSTLLSGEETMQILSNQLQDEYTCSTPKEKNPSSHPSSKYKVSSETSWHVRNMNSGDVCREAPDGGEKQASGTLIDPGQVQVLLNHEQTTPNTSELSHIQAHANTLASRLMMHKTSSSSSSDLMDKLSLIDIEKYGFDSLLSLPSFGASYVEQGVEKADQGGENLEIFSILGTSDFSSDSSGKQPENNVDAGCNGASKNDMILHHDKAQYSIEKSEQNEQNYLPSFKKSRIPRLIQSSTNTSDVSFVSNSTFLNHSSNGSHNDKSLSKSVSNSQSLSSDPLPSHLFQSPLTSESLLSSVPVKHGPESNSTRKNKDMGRRSLSALALDCEIPINHCNKAEKNKKRKGHLNRSNSVSMCSLPSSQKRASYIHVQSKVKQYIHDIKISQSRRASPSRSDTNSPCKTSTSSGPANSVYLLNEDILCESDGALPVELQSLVRQLEGASGDPRLLRTLFRVLLNERQTRSEHEHTLAAMQLSYDNLLAAHARSQNLIDDLRLQVTASCNGSCERINHRGFSSVTASRASSPLHRERRHSVAIGGQGPTLRGSGPPEELSLSQPNLIKETMRHVTENNLGISLDESGSMYLFPTPFESNSSIALFTNNEPTKSGPNITNERGKTSTSLMSHDAEYEFSPENSKNEEVPGSESSYISNERLPPFSDQMNFMKAAQLPQTSSTLSTTVSVCHHSSNAPSAPVISGQSKGEVLLREKVHRTQSIPDTPQDRGLVNTLPTKLRDFAALLSCGAITEQEKINVWTELVSSYNHLMRTVGDSNIKPLGAAMQLLAGKFGLTPLPVEPMTVSVGGNKTQPHLNTSMLATTGVVDERDSKFNMAIRERSLDRGVTDTHGQDLYDPKWSGCHPEQDPLQTMDHGGGFSDLIPEEKVFSIKTSVGKSMGITASANNSILPQYMTEPQSANAVNNEGYNQTNQSVEEGVSDVPNHFTNFSVHDVSDNERVSESVQVPELDSIYTVNEDTSSLSAEDYSKYISVLKRLHWKLSRQENASKPKNRASVEPKTDYLSKIRSLNERIEQLCIERNRNNSRSTPELKPSNTDEAHNSKAEPPCQQKPEETPNDRSERHSSHHRNPTQTATKSNNLLTREAFASNESLSPVSALEKVEMWRERLVASVTDSENDDASYSETSALKPCSLKQNLKKQISGCALQKKNLSRPSIINGEENSTLSIRAASDRRYSVGELRDRDPGALSKRFDLDSGCPVSDRSFKHFQSPHTHPKYNRMHYVPSGSEKSGSDGGDPAPLDSECNNTNVGKTQFNKMRRNGTKLKLFVEEQYPRTQKPVKTVIDGNHTGTWDSSLKHFRNQPMPGIDQSISNNSSQTSVVTGNSRTCDRAVHQTLLKLQRDVDLMKSNFLARTGTSGKTSSRTRPHFNLTDMRSPDKRMSRRAPVRAVLNYPTSTSDSDAESILQEGHCGGVRRRTRRSEGVPAKLMSNSPDASLNVRVSPRAVSRPSKSGIDHPDSEVRGANHSRTSSSPRLIRKRKKRSHSCPRMVPSKPLPSRFVDEQPTGCQCDTGPEFVSRPLVRHPSLPVLSGNCQRCRLNAQRIPSAPLSHREHPRHQLSSSLLQFSKCSSSCRVLPSCSGVGCGNRSHKFNNEHVHACSSLRNLNVYDETPSINGLSRSWKSDCDFGEVKSDKHGLANHICASCSELHDGHHTKYRSCDISKSDPYRKCCNPCCSSCGNCKSCRNSNDKLWMSLDTATALADSVHARSRCLLLSLRSRTPTATVVPNKGSAASNIVQADVITAVDEVVCPDTVASKGYVVIGGDHKLS